MKTKRDWEIYDLKKRIAYERAAVYERFVAAYFRKLGWGVTHLNRGNSKDDPGDLHIDRNGREEIVDVKEAEQWVERPGRQHDWLEWQALGLTSDDQFHEDWIYCVVAHDFHAMAFINPKNLPDEAFVVAKNRNKANGKEYKWVKVKKQYTKPYSLHVSGRPIQ